ncbi:Alginate biosynthesis protein AlgA [Roseovarius gaetbuli]|uniref:Alginate biosynthesis protein AlgA n=1 Tax=Roseovarius gaetbuli TaxID=1356575 RepID=A0A1X7ADI6_9RHOB|nr:Alginate biosynthesis protein AlgA [Roseovarius gaetbuli]
MAKNNGCVELVLLFWTGLRLSQDASGLGLYSAWGGAPDGKSGKVPMVLIEVQTGACLGEDDIIRYEDMYARS